MKTAIAFFVYNRLDTTQVVFERIREIKPPRLYLICDAASSLTRMWTGTVRFTRTMRRKTWAARIVYPQA